MVDEGTIAYRPDLKQCLIEMTVPQSQGRKPNTPNLIFDLDSTLSEATKVDTAVCTCYRKSKDIVCKHKGGHGMSCVITAAMGGAGDVVQRKRYWEGHTGGVGGTQAATRTVHLATDRTSQVKLEEIRELEESAKASPPPPQSRLRRGRRRRNKQQPAPPSLPPPQQLPAPPQAKKRKHAAAGSSRPALKKRVMELYKKHVHLDALKLRKIEIKHNIMRYTRECMFDDN
jgi:hypothetical protein